MADWGVFMAVVLMFGLNTALTMFQRIIVEIFGEFMQVFLDEFAVYGT